MTNLYNINKKTGKFEGAISKANVNPKYGPDTHNINDKFIFNAQISSLIEPPETAENEACILKNGKWEIVTDRVGQSSYAKDGSIEYITELGDDIPDGNLTDPSPSIYHTSHDGVDWIKDLVIESEAKALETRISEIKDAQNETGLIGLALAEATDKIDELFKDATTIAKLKACQVDFNKKILTLLLK